MKQIIIPVTAVLAILLAAAGAAFALTGGSDIGGQSGGADELARCAEGTTDCSDPNTVTDGEGGQATGDPFAICVEGTVDCNDTPTSPGEPTAIDPNAPTSGDGVDPNECSLTHNIAVCQDKAVALVTEDLVARTGAEPVLVAAEYTDWPDTSLGNAQPGMFYAQVITPGFKIILEAGGAQYEYHTDLAGNFTLLD
jgi:hypothetical protein